MSDTIGRFSNRVENYVRYRPHYPPAVLDLMRREMGLTAGSVVADIGSGPGISAVQFLENGNVVYCIEPNDAMRAAAEAALARYPNFVSRNGTAEDTGLENDSVDIVVAAQAFHWFEPSKARREFERVLTPGGWIVLIWNERQTDSTPFLRGYEEALLRFGRDYEQVRHDNIHSEKLGEFFMADYREATFANEQVLDFAGLRGRAASSSYLPSPDDPAFDELEKELAALFAHYAENDRIKLLYDTKVFYQQY